jgi:two-component system CheB/CheR fusion protein
MAVKANCAYVIPPNRDMAILHGSLQLMAPTAPRGLRLPIDYFFRALAQDQEERAICIILSGTGTDGTLGLKAVKERGGMVMVQQPETAKYDGMPRSAIATGMADYVLAPGEMAAQLKTFVEYAFNPGVKPRPTPVPQKAEDLKKVFVLLRGQTGHDFSYYKPSTIQRRIERRMNLNQIGLLRDYVQYLDTNPLEIETLFKELLIGVSSFFRDPEAFAALKEKVIPALFKDKRQDEAVRVWVSGCATGEEAYSLAMLLREHLDTLGQERKLQVFATDIDSNAIEKARSGTYPDSIAVDVPPAYLNRYFSKQDNTFQVTKVVRDILVFSEQNVIKDPPFSRLDLISCRNLLIYMEGELQKRLFPLFYYALREGGYLFLGNSESIGDATDLFGVLDRKWKIFRRKGGVLSPAVQETLARVPFPLKLGDRDNDKATKLTPALSPRELTERLLLEDYAPACVLVNENGEGRYFYGATGKYLQPPEGEASWNILGMAREGLQLDLSTAMRKVIAHKKSVCFEKLSVKTNGGNQLINLTVKPIAEQSGGQGAALLVIFEDIAPAAVESREIAELSSTADHRIADLERELRSTREHLQTTIEELETSNEELKSTNEELQSANEELQSTNEELETSKEELQSVNEELVTVNAEHEVKLEELSKTNNDMINLLASTDVGTVFLDDKLCIQRFTPAVTRVIKLIGTDIGRPLSDIATNLKDCVLVGNAQQVLRTLEPHEQKVETQDGYWYSVRIRPYRTTENVIEGVVLTFIDVDEIQRRLAMVVRDSNDAITLQDLTGRITVWNRGAERMYGYTEREALKMNIRDIVPEPNRSEALEFVNAIARGEVIPSFETRRLTKDGRVLDVWLTVTLFDDGEGKPTGIATTERDITELKRLRHFQPGQE